MKNLLPLTACACVLAFSVPSIPAAEVAPAPAGATATQVETTPPPAGIRKVGRFFKGAAKVVGGGLKKTGQVVGKAAGKAGKGIGRVLGKKGTGAAPAPVPAPVQ